MTDRQQDIPIAGSSLGEVWHESAGASWRPRVLGRSLAVLIAALALFEASCGGDGGGSCGKVAPCGGNLVGSWTFTGACVTRAGVMTDLAGDFASFCPTATVGAAAETASGMIAFNADASYAVDITQSASLTIDVPASCIAGASCSAYAAAIEAQGDPSIQSVSCQGTSVCVCTLVTAPQSMTDSGTYSTSGTVATLASVSGGGSTGGDYCAQGNELHLLTVDRTMNMGPMGQAIVDEDIVATK